MDDRINDIFGRLDDKERLAAHEAKERIWSKVQPATQKKKGNQWWLLLLLGGLLFTSGWYFRPLHVSEPTQKLRDKTIEQSPDAGLQLALNEANLFLKRQQKTLDSLRVINNSLTDRLLAVSEDNSASDVHQVIEVDRIIRDTIYLTQIRVEQKVIEKLVRDTIILEVPSIEPMQEPMANISNDLSEEISEEGSKAKKSTLPTSIHFNFSETNHIDK